MGFRSKSVELITKAGRWVGRGAGKIAGRFGREAAKANEKMAKTAGEGWKAESSAGTKAAEGAKKEWKWKFYEHKPEQANWGKGWYKDAEGHYKHNFKRSMKEVRETKEFRAYEHKGVRPKEKVHIKEEKVHDTKAAETETPKNTRTGGKGTAPEGKDGKVNTTTRDGEALKENAGGQKTAGGPGVPPPSGPTYGFGKDLTMKSLRGMYNLAMKNPWMTALLGFTAFQVYAGQKDGLGMIQRLQGLLLGPQYDEKGNLRGANGLAPTVTGLYTGTEEMQQGGNFYDATGKYTIGERRFSKVNLALDRVSNEGWYIVGQGNKLIDATGHVCGEVHDGAKDLLGKVVNGSGEVIGEMRDGKVMTYGNDDGVSEGGESQDGNYMGNSGQTPTRAQQLSQAMGPAELAGGIVATMMTRSWPIRILGGLTAFNGYQNIRQHSQQMQNSVNQGYSQGGGQQPSVTYQPSDEVVVNTGRGV